MATPFKKKLDGGGCPTGGFSVALYVPKDHTVLSDPVTFNVTDVVWLYASNGNESIANRVNSSLFTKPS